jgi:hypothetical protein
LLAEAGFARPLAVRPVVASTVAVKAANREAVRVIEALSQQEAHPR